VLRRWRSPLPSKQASERWAREKAKTFLADLSHEARTCSPHPGMTALTSPPPVMSEYV
jgi:hypothetical protein